MYFRIPLLLLLPRLFRGRDTGEQFAVIEHVGARRSVGGNKHQHFFVMSAVVVQSVGRVAHVLSGLESNLLRRLPCLGPLTGVPRPFQYDAVPLVGMGMWPAHHSRWKSVDREVETRLGGV